MGRRKRRKERRQENRKEAHDRRDKQKDRQKQSCKPEPASETCDGKCGPVRNRCKDLVECEPCACEPDVGACDETCGMVVNSCGETVDCGPCDCSSCGVCTICNPESGQCDADSSAVGTACGGTGQECQPDGSCACPVGEHVCNGVCVNRQTDPANCGRCGITCPRDNTCQDGTCTCNAGGYTMCGGSCVNLLKDSSNCGACGEVCPPETPDCCGITLLDTFCTNFQTSTLSCGSCWNWCEEGESCIDGRCVCPRGSVYCNGVCRDLQNDPEHCGECNNECPLQGQSSASWVTCEHGSCQLRCYHWDYDLNNDPADGCETNGMAFNHTKEDAHPLGPYFCLDDDIGQFTGSIFSDRREHMHLPNFNPYTGAAPRWWKALAGDDFCLNDPEISLVQTSGTSGCYKFAFESDTLTREEIITGGSLVVDMDAGSYPDDTYVYFRIEKICDTTIVERADFGVIFHL